MAPEIDWGPETTKPDTGRLAHIEHAFIVKHTRAAELARIDARNARIKKLTLIPLSLIIVGAAATALLDYFHVIDLGLFHRANNALVTVSLPLQPGEQDAAASASTAQESTVRATSVVHDMPAPIVEAPVAMPADPERMSRAKDRAEHATHGIRILSDEINHEQAALDAGEALITADQRQLPQAQRSLQLAYGVQNIRDWQAEIERLQTEIHDQSSADDESRDHITSLSARLAKAQKDFVDASADYIMAEGSAGEPQAPAPRYGTRP